MGKKRTRSIESMLVNQQMEIEQQWGLQLLLDYLHDLYLLENTNTSIRDLGYSERLESLSPSVIGFSEEVSGQTDLSSASIPPNSLAHLRLSGVMRLESGWCHRGVRELISDISAADANPNLSGIIIEVNSGGGESIAGSELMNALKDVESNGRTKVGVYSQFMCSAAYRGMLPSNFVFASSRNSVFGSIGTYVQISKALLDDIRENYIEVYASQSYNKNFEERELMRGNVEPLKEYVTKIAQSFIDDVLEYRLILSGADRVTSGAVFTAEEAMEVGLIDGISTFAGAIERMQSEINRSKFYAGFPASQNFNDEMKSLKEFMGKLFPSLNEKLGTELTDSSEPQDFLDAVDGAESISDLKEQIDNQKSNTDDNSDRLQSLEDKLSKLTDSFEGLKGENADLKEANDKLSAGKKKVEGELADIKGKGGQHSKNGGKEEGKSDDSPGKQDFDTMRNFYETAAPKGKAKYEKPQA